MMNVSRQIEIGKIVCPVTGQLLEFDARKENLVTSDRTRSYRLIAGGIPILLQDEDWASKYSSASSRMSREYSPKDMAKRNSLLARLKSRIIKDYRSKASIQAFHEVFDKQLDSALCISIGGGPDKPHPSLVNLNIGPFPNVDVVADAHNLPYAQACVDAIYCEAVLEHLHGPARAVQEMHRVLKPGGEVFAVTPFLQAFHAYPSHYQNLTLNGHIQLFVTNDFEVLRSGTCVGPAYTMVSLISTFLQEYIPCGKLLSKGWGLIGAFLRPCDLVLNQRENAHVLASTTFLVAKKRGC